MAGVARDKCLQRKTHSRKRETSLYIHCTATSCSLHWRHTTAYPTYPSPTCLQGRLTDRSTACGLRPGVKSLCVQLEASSEAHVRSQSPHQVQPARSILLTTKDEDTIAAIVTGSVSQGTVSIIRVSGTDALKVAQRVFRPGGKAAAQQGGWQPKSHTITWGTAVSMAGHVLDEVLLLAMWSPRSYTCEDVIEIHTHGGGVCAARVLQACIQAGARRARPGEFTLRAFLNGRLDLSQAEAVSSLLSARTPAAADSALAGLQGGLSTLVRALRQRTIALLAEIEARLDFDEDLPAMDAARLQGQVESIQSDIEGALRTARQGVLLRQGLSVAIVGQPNVGKSSLLNAWSRTDRAIVTEVAGTTRDVVNVELVVGGVPVTLLDTAGIRDSGDVVERIGVQRSREAAAAADIVVMVIDAQAGWTDADGDIFTALWGSGPGSSSCAVQGQALLVANKKDLVLLGDGGHVAGTTSPQATGHSSSNGAGCTVQLPVLAKEVFKAVVYTSAKDQEGIAELDEALLQLAGAPALAQGGASWAVNERQAEALVRAHEALSKVVESVRGGLPIDFWTIDLRAALIALGEVSGDEVTEEILDQVFSAFCIGK